MRGDLQGSLTKSSCLIEIPLQKGREICRERIKVTHGVRLNESPPKRKGNTGPTPARVGFSLCLNESLRLKVQDKRSHSHLGGILICFIESPYKQEGKCNIEGLNQATLFVTSMKVPTKP